MAESQVTSDSDGVQKSFFQRLGKFKKPELREKFMKILAREVARRKSRQVA
jgi:hypothetical protein